MNRARSSRKCYAHCLRMNFASRAISAHFCVVNPKSIHHYAFDLSGFQNGMILSYAKYGITFDENF
jgi:hypothetical protein